MIGLIKDKTSNSTMIAELEEAILSGTVTSDALLPTETATSPAACGAISSVSIVTSSGASGGSSNAAAAMLSAASGASSNAAGATSSGASGASSNAAGTMSPAASGAASSTPLESPASPQPAVLVLPVVVTQPAATPPSDAATPHAAAAAPHPIVVTQPASTLHAAAATPPAAAVASSSTVVSLPAAGPRLATVEKPAGPETLQSCRRRKSLAKARLKERAASESEASASEEESLPAERSVAARSSKRPRLAEFKYAGSRSSDSTPPPLRIATNPSAAESSPVSNAESILIKRAETPPLPHTPGPRFPESASQPAPPITAPASEAFDEDDVVILTPHPDVSASSSRAVTPVVAGQLSPHVIVQVPVPQTPDPWASTTAAFPERPIVSMQFAVVVLVKSTRFTFKANNAPVDITRHVVVQTDGGRLANWRVDIRTPTILNSLDYQLIYQASKSQLLLKKYSELVHFLLDSLSDRYFVFYDRESTLEALRLALPRDRSVDVGLHVLLRNDALRAGGTIWNRSRSRLAPLREL